MVCKDVGGESTVRALGLLKSSIFFEGFGSRGKVNPSLGLQDCDFAVPEGSVNSVKSGRAGLDDLGGEGKMCM